MNETRSPLDTVVDREIEQACPGLSASQAFELADVIEYAMDMPANHGRTWTPSKLGREVRLGGLHPETHQVIQVLGWLVRHGYVKTDERGAWSHYFR